MNVILALTVSYPICFYLGYILGKGKKPRMLLVASLVVISLLMLVPGALSLIAHRVDADALMAMGLVLMAPIGYLVARLAKKRLELTQKWLSRIVVWLEFIYCTFGAGYSLYLSGVFFSAPVEESPLLVIAREWMLFMLVLLSASYFRPSLAKHNSPAILGRTFVLFGALAVLVGELTSFPRRFLLIAEGTFLGAVGCIAGVAALLIGQHKPQTESNLGN